METLITGASQQISVKFEEVDIITSRKGLVGKTLDSEASLPWTDCVAIVSTLQTWH